MGNEAEESTVSEWIKSFIVAIIIALFIKTFIFNITLVIGDSMLPTLHERDRLVVNRFSTVIKGYDRGDVVVLKAPDDNRKYYIKRIIGIEGDIVQLIDGDVVLNGETLGEHYASTNFTHFHNGDYWEVGEGEVFVLGDNREQWASKDSRYFGCVPEGLLRGKTSFRFFPLTNIGKLNN